MSNDHKGPPPLRALGASGLRVPALGLGAGQLGDEGLSEAEAERLLRGAVERGVTLIDTAPSYGLSEERIGRYLGEASVVRSTKLGYGVEGEADWTGRCITAGVERALRRLRCEALDLAHLHSCPRWVLERGEVVEALARAVRQGKVRVAAYSGEGDALGWAIEAGVFGAVQASVSVCDQGSSRGPLRRARERGLGVLAKRPLANAPWRPGDRGGDEAASAYQQRWRALGLGLSEAEAPAVALRYCVFHTPAHAALLGTRRLSSLDSALGALGAGPLDEGLVGLIEASFTARGRGWAGMV